MEEQGIGNGYLPIEQILSAAEVCDFEYGRCQALAEGLTSAELWVEAVQGQ